MWLKRWKKRLAFRCYIAIYIMTSIMTRSESRNLLIKPSACLNSLIVKNYSLNPQLTASISKSHPNSAVCSSKLHFAKDLMNENRVNFTCFFKFTRFNRYLIYVHKTVLSTMCINTKTRMRYFCKYPSFGFQFRAKTFLES